jgi:hypothetical protein
VLLFACGKQAEECRAVTARANQFIAQSERIGTPKGASREETQEQALATARRYEALAADLRAIGVESSELSPEVESYRALAERSAAALRAVAAALASHDFEAARKKRVELATAGKAEGPLVSRINRICKP